MQRQVYPTVVDDRPLTLSNLTKILFPKADFSKAAVIQYYTQIAPALIPHLKGRPLTLKRYPGGVEEDFFYEKRCPSHKPAWIRTITVETSEGPVSFCNIDSLAALVWVANLAALELHTLLAAAPKLDRPTSVVFDLDPGPPAGILLAAKYALVLRDLLEHLKLKCFVKVSGSKGIHIHVPLNTPVDFETTKTFARAVAQLVAGNAPAEVTNKMTKNLRTGKVFIDWSQNDTHKTTVAVYSLRAMPSPTVSAPVTWKELETAIKKKDTSLLEFSPDEVVKRFKKEGDLFAEALTLKQRLPTVQ